MKNRQNLIALLILVTGTSYVMCQDDNGVVQQQQQAIVVRAADDVDGETSIMAFEMSDVDGSFFLADSFDTSFGLGLGANANQFSMLNNANVQQDLQLVDEQLEQIQQINEEFGQKIKEQMDLMKDENGNFNFQVGSDFRDLMRDLRQQQQDQISAILLPNQQKRLQQVARQMRMKQLGTEKSLTGKLAEELGISAEQKKRIRNKSQELTRRLEEQIAELRAKAKKELLNELTAEQRDKLTELIGDEFIEKRDENQRRFRMIRPGADDSNSGDF